MPEAHLNWGYKNPAEFLIHLKHEPIRKAVADRITLLIEEHNHKEILEIGFGSGGEYERLKPILRKYGANYTGLDITESFVQYAKTKFPETKWFAGDCRSMRFKNKQFDLTFMFHVLEHQKNLHDLSEAILETCRITKSHILIIWFLNPIFKPSHKEINRHHRGLHYYCSWNYYQITELIDMSDFRLKSIFWMNPHKNKCWLLEAL